MFLMASVVRVAVDGSSVDWASAASSAAAVVSASAFESTAAASNAATTWSAFSSAPAAPRRVAALGPDRRRTNSRRSAWPSSTWPRPASYAARAAALVVKRTKPYPSDLTTSEVADEVVDAMVTRSVVPSLAGTREHMVARSESSSVSKLRFLTYRVRAASSSSCCSACVSATPWSVWSSAGRAASRSCRRVSIPFSLARSKAPSGAHSRSSGAPWKGAYAQRRMAPLASLRD
mmetsp:Transcript_2237/g.7083  ORF Transcript_2237/g.7083 Transcript_2237/m.7083 type:complete len:233 (+) Transcript_2237:2272-2970(+)